jgi:hypothetical protein
LCKEANLKRHKEADASVTLLPGNSHFVPFAERDQIVICLMRGTDRTRDAIA